MTRHARGPRSGRGFSLIESLVALAVASFIFLIVCAVLVPGVKSCRTTQFSLDLTQNARVAPARMVREIRAARAIATPQPDAPDDPDFPPPQAIMVQDPGCDHPRYLSYYQSGDEVHRRIYTFHLPGDPDTPVYFDDRDALDQPAVAVQGEDTVVARYVKGLEFWGANPIIISMIVNYHGTVVPCGAAVFLRNDPAPESE
jgi:prepilin-type N-terminal cleavage/methylation domain-containing protein